MPSANVGLACCTEESWILEQFGKILGNQRYMRLNLCNSGYLSLLSSLVSVSATLHVSVLLCINVFQNLLINVMKFLSFGDTMLIIVFLTSASSYFFM